MTLTRKGRRSRNARRATRSSWARSALAADERRTRIARAGRAVPSSSLAPIGVPTCPWPGPPSSGRNAKAARAAADRPLADEDRPRLGRLLEPRRDVDRVAGHEEVARAPASRLATTSPLLTPSRIGRSSPSARIVADAVAQLERRVEGPGGIIAVGGRQPEHRHDRVADELLDRPAVALDDLAARSRSSAPAEPAGPRDRATRRARSSR